MKKRLLSVFLALCLTLGLLPGTARAAKATSGTCGAYCTYRVDQENSTLIISGTGPMVDYPLYPGDMDYPNFMYQGPYWGPFVSMFSTGGLKNIIIENGVTYIGGAAFFEAKTLESVSISSSVTAIGSGAFGECSNLTSVTIPESVTSMDGAFNYCPNSIVCSPNLTIYCYKNSYAHQYAEQRKIPFVLLDGDPDTPDPPDIPAPTIQSVTMTRDGAAYDLLTQTADFEYGSEESVDVSATVDWDGGEAGRVFLVQDRDTYVELTSPSIAITPGTTFYPSPDRPVYAIATNAAADTLLDWKLTTLRITEPEEPEPEGTGLLVKDGLFAFRPAIVGTVDAMYNYHYDEHWFLSDSYAYQHDLVKMSIRGAVAAYGRGYDSDSRNIAALMSDLEFQNITTAYPIPDMNTIGYAIGSKTITPNESNGDDFQPFSLIMVAVRGGGYYDEWAGNFNIGTSTDHAGFRTAADSVLSGVKNYIDSNRSSLADTVKVWVMGFSRAAATTNLVAKELDDQYIPDVKAENVYAFCFECPQNTTNGNTDNAKYKNISCIANPIDIVTKVAMSDWGFQRYGSTYYLPYREGVENYAAAKNRMKAEYGKLMDSNSSLAGGSVSGFVEKVTDEKWGQAQLTDRIAGSAADLFEDRFNYTALHQSTVMSILKKTMGREKEDLSVWEKVYAGSIVVAFGKCYTDVGPLVSLLESLPEVGDAVKAIVMAKITAEIAQILHKGNLFGYAHYPELCLSWLDSLEGKDGYADPRYRIIFINCPVDVRVYDKNGTKVAEMTDDTVMEMPDGIAAWIDMDGQKVVAVPNEMEYRIELTATADGEVTYTATEYDMSAGRTEKVVSYYEVEVETGDTLTGTVENLSDKPDASYPLILNSGSGALTPDIQQSGGAVQMYSVEPSASGSGAVTGGGTYVNGEFAKVKAIPDSGAEFSGWYIQDELVSEEPEYRFLVSKNVHITAKFTDNTPPAPPNPPTPPAPVFYKITFDPNGGLESRITLTTGANGKLLAAMPTPTRDGYTFDGWYTAPTGGEKVNADRVYRSDTTLYAHWIENALPPADVTYTITFDANGGSGTMPNAAVAEGEAFTLPVCTFIAPDGKEFKAWSIDGAEYASGAGYTFTGDTTVTAVWQDKQPVSPVNYTITFSSNGEIFTVTATENVPLVLPACTFTVPDGKEFKAWNIDGKEYAPGTSHTFVADTTVTAVWQDTAPAPEHTHDWETAWSCDETHHWKECSTSECPITENSSKSEYGEHTYDNENAAVCSTCEYKRAVTPPAPPRPTAGEETYYISIPRFTGGEIIPSTRYAEQGERVTLAAYPSKGYELEAITVTDVRGHALALRDSGNNRYSFIMPDTRVTVEASFVRIADNTPSAPAEDEPFTGLGTPGISGIVLNPAAMPFTDVRTGDWFYNSVDYVWKHYLMSGVSDTQFAPQSTTTRAMIWTILARMNNVSTEAGSGSAWYERGKLWAMEQGVTDGTNPLGDITREQLVTMLWRNAGSPSAATDLSQFSDNNTVSGYAQNAVNWAVANGILNGSDGKLNPKGTAARAQVSAMVMRYGERIGA